jgi:thiamine-phosphate pyrophosphorylase
MSDGCQLYLITPPRIELASFRDAFAAALDAGPIGCVQLRLPDAAPDALRRAADTLRPLAQDRDVAFLLNGTAKLATELGCDGVHLDDWQAVAAARRTLGTEISIGVSCGTYAQRALDAGDDGADYVSFGPFFATPSQPDAPLAELDMLTWWSQVMTLPVVAVGGITPANCAPLVAAGADFLAVIGAVWACPEGPAEGVKAMIAAMAQAR